MQCISSIILALATAGTLVTAAPAPAPMPAPTASPVPAAVPEDILSMTSTVAQSIATPASAFMARGATVDAFASKCTVGSDSVATCTGAIHDTNVWAGILEATVDSTNS